VYTMYDLGSGLQNFNISALTYNGAGQMLTIRSYLLNFNDMTSYLLNSTDSFGYISAIDYSTFWQENYYDEDEVLADGIRLLRPAGSNGLPVTASILSYNGGNWAEDTHLDYTYNSFNNPTRIEGTENGSPVGTINMYYENYEDGISGIAPVAANKDFSIYPNPFSDKINIEWKGKAQSKITMRMMNILGQEVFANTMILNAGANTVSLPELISGNYILLIQDASGNSWSQKVLKK
ncbi:MAG: T9SS type A sorting domain-containing protein, partial [Sphingobacteriales bacterium]